MSKLDDDFDDGVSALSDLTESEKLALEKEARTEVAKEAKEKKKQAFKDAAKDRMKAQALFRDGKDHTGADVETITLDLAPAQHFICLDGTKYYHGRTYSLSQNVMAVVKDIAYRGWKEESARLGEDTNAFYGRQKKNSMVGGRYAH